jgi:hypothetical protein
MFEAGQVLNSAAGGVKLFQRSQFLRGYLVLSCRAQGFPYRRIESGIGEVEARVASVTCFSWFGGAAVLSESSEQLLALI